MKLKVLQLVIVSAILVFAACNNAGTNVAKDVKLTSELDSISYLIGVDIASNVKRAGIEEIDINAFAVGFAQVINGDSTQISAADAQTKVRAYIRKTQELKAENSLKENTAFLEENKKKEGITTTASGLQYKIIKKGDGDIPISTDKVKVHYKGTLINGDVFDSSYDRNEPAVFPVTGVIKGWQEALQLMPVGSKWTVYIPSEIAYGKRAQGKITPNSTLIFEMELLEIVKEEEKKKTN